MRIIHVLLAGAAIATATAADAADQLKFGKAPAWVVAQAIPGDDGKNSEAPVAMLLLDRQIHFEPGRTVTYSEVAIKIQKPQGLAAGNISLPWNPATETVTVNKLQIRRGSQVIDVLAGGQKFTTMRRESGLEEATLDGYLTANIQPEGLEEGDVLDLATTIDHSDPVTGSHVEASFADWPPTPVGLAHVRLEWPATLKLNLQGKGVSLQPVAHGATKTVEISARDVQPIIPPSGAPGRFSVTRLGEASDYGSWSDVADLMMPLFKKAEMIAPTGHLHDEVEKIRASTSDPKLRAQEALQLVQDRVRYVALVMGQGGLVPADAETTWSRRFGDCKAKTALLLGILHSLGIKAEPVLVQSDLGDAIAERLPMISYFDHVLVQAHLGNKTYYLDGTRTGDTDIEDIKVPNFGWGLPLLSGAHLVHIVPPPLDQPEAETELDVDASNGIYAAAPTKGVLLLRGDNAVVLNTRLGALTDVQRRQFLEQYWRKAFTFIDYQSGATSFDKAKRELQLTMTATSKLEWQGGQFHVPDSTVGYEADFTRVDGPYRDAPFAVAYPDYSKTTIRLRMPPSFVSGRQFAPQEFHETLAGIEYDRSTKMSGNLLTVENSARSVVPEISAADARAVEARLKTLAEEDVALTLPATYHPTPADLLALQKSKPESASDYFNRAASYLASGKAAEALSDLNAGLELDPKNEWALAKRATINIGKHDYTSAAADVAAITVVDPANPGLPQVQAAIAEGKGDFRECVTAYTKVIESAPKTIAGKSYLSKAIAAKGIEFRNTYALTHRAMCEQGLGNDEAALADSAKALKTMPFMMQLRVLRANIFMHERKPDLVKREAEAVTRDNPYSNYAFVIAAKTFAALGDRDRAMRLFARALALKPEAYIYVNRADVRPSSDTAGKLADLDLALRLDPTNVDALRDKAQLVKPQQVAGKN